MAGCGWQVRMKKLPLLLMLLGVAGFIYGLVSLFSIRFESGDVYPAYSSLRADPKGTKALYESLGALQETRRNFRPLSKIKEAEGASIFVLGLDPESWSSPDEITEFERLATAGSRVVLAFKPFPNPPLPGPLMLPGRRTGPSAPDAQGFQRLANHFQSRWNIGFRYYRLPEIEGDRIRAEAAQRLITNDLPVSITVRTTLHFRPADDSWQVIYARSPNPTNELAVLIERPFGRGSIILAADAFPFSNEALRHDRQPELLAWFAGGNDLVIFDEAHLGVQDSRGVAGLARQYRLHGLFAALLILAGLFVWRRITPFLPPHEDELARERGDLVAGRESAAGFINLLRRNISSDQILKICLEQWNAHFARTRKPSVEKLRQMQALIDEQNALEPRRRNPVQTYQRFCQILSRSAKR